MKEKEGQREKERGEKRQMERGKRKEACRRAVLREINMYSMHGLGETD